MCKRKLFILVVIYLLKVSFAKAHFYDRKAEGWHWYEDRYQKSDVKDQKKEDRKSEEVQDPSQMIQALRQDAEKKLHSAILDPSEANIIAYLKAQKQIYDLSYTFAENWQRTLVNYPELDETIKFPVTQVGRHTYLQQEQERKEQTIRALSQQYGLFFFFKGDCVYCHKFAPIVQAFAQKYGWDVIALSIDGGTAEPFKNAQRDQGMAERLGINIYPTLLAYDTRSHNLIPICSGLISLQDIENRIDLMTRGKR